MEVYCVLRNHVNGLFSISIVRINTSSKFSWSVQITKSDTKKDFKDKNNNK